MRQSINTYTKKFEKLRECLVGKHVIGRTIIEVANTADIVFCEGGNNYIDLQIKVDVFHTWENWSWHVYMPVKLYDYSKYFHLLEVVTITGKEGVQHLEVILPDANQKTLEEI